MFSCNKCTLNMSYLCVIKKAMPQKYTITNSTNGSTEIDIFGDIDSMWGYNLPQLRDDLSRLSDTAPITVNVSTYGGDVLEAFAIADVLGQVKNEVTTVGLGIVASAGTVILLSGKKKKLAKNAFFMIHLPTTLTGGDAEEFRKTAGVLDKISDQLGEIYTDVIESNGKLIDGDRDKTKKKVMQWVKDETWFSASEALEAGFINEITEQAEAFITPTTVAQIQQSIAAYKNTPQIITNKIAEMKNTESNGILEAIKHLFISAGLIKAEADTTPPAADTPPPAADTTPPSADKSAEQKEVEALTEKVRILTEKLEALNTAPPPSLNAHTTPPPTTPKNMAKDEAEQWQKLATPFINQLK